MSLFDLVPFKYSQPCSYRISKVDDQHRCVKISLPGYNREDIKVTYLANEITVKAKHEKELDSGQTVKESIFRFNTEHEVLPESITCKYENDILSLIYPIQAQVRKETEIKVS